MFYCLQIPLVQLVRTTATETPNADQPSALTSASVSRVTLVTEESVRVNITDTV